MRIAAVFSVFVGAVVAPAVLAQQPPKQRDLRIERMEDVPAPPKTVTPPRSWAVVVGVSQYPKLAARQQLQFTERDAQSIYSILISPEGGAFKAENVHVLNGAKATLAALRHEIDEWLPSVAREQDRVLIYFAGHGFVYEGQGYLAPVDINPANVKGTGYPMRELSDVIANKIHARWKIVMADACHSGMISPEESQNLNNTLAGLGTSLFSLTASRDREQSLEDPTLDGGHGVFTYYVVQGLQGSADTSRDGIVTADEIAEYVHTQVREYTRGQQNPTSDRGSFDAAMQLSYVPANAEPATPPEPKYGTLVFEVNKEGVEIFVDGKSIGVVNPGAPYQLSGLTTGEHTIKGVKMGYEPDGPRQEMVYPGQTSTVTIKILIPRHRAKAVQDLLDKGIEYYQKGYEQNYKKAAELFEQALRQDATYSQAAFYLGLTYNALFDEEKAAQYYRHAIDIDPDYLEAHANYAGMLLDTGSVDEAIRQIDIVLTRQPDHAVALTMLAQADRFKELYPQAIEAARKAIQLSPKNAEPHLWLADSLRLSNKMADAIPEYVQYLKLSDFDCKLAGQLNYYVLGSLFGMGRKKRAAERDIWKDLRSLAYFGICECHRLLADYDQAIGYCQKALSYDARDPYAHYALGLSYMHKYNQDQSIALLYPARSHLQEVIDINPDLEEAAKARKNLANIEKVLGK
jgi:tetratricopeptide (TPR) repeat protein